MLGKALSGVVLGLALLSLVEQAANADDQSRKKPDKVIVATFLFEEKAVKAQAEPQQVIVAFGSGKLPNSDSRDFVFELFDNKDHVLAEYGILDPRKMVAEEGEQKGKGFRKVPRATYTVKFPFHAKAVGIRVRDTEKKKVVATLDLRPFINAFCDKPQLVEDKDCRIFHGLEASRSYPPFVLAHCTAPACSGTRLRA